MAAVDLFISSSDQVLHQVVNVRRVVRYADASRSSWRISTYLPGYCLLHYCDQNAWRNEQGRQAPTAVTTLLGYGSASNLKFLYLSNQQDPRFNIRSGWDQMVTVTLEVNIGSNNNQEVAITESMIHYCLW